MNSHKGTTKVVNDFVKSKGQEEGLFKFGICGVFLQEDGFKSSKSTAFQPAAVLRFSILYIVPKISLAW
jgi:uncharacterized membrane protein YjjP (DUF1212 family)